MTISLVKGIRKSILMLNSDKNYNVFSAKFRKLKIEYFLKIS